MFISKPSFLFCKLLSEGGDKVLKTFSWLKPTNYSKLKDLGQKTDVITSQFIFRCHKPEGDAKAWPHTSVRSRRRVTELSISWNIQQNKTSPSGKAAVVKLHHQSMRHSHSDSNEPSWKTLLPLHSYSKWQYVSSPPVYWFCHPADWDSLRKERSFNLSSSCREETEGSKRRECQEGRKWCPEKGL